METRGRCVVSVFLSRVLGWVSSLARLLSETIVIWGLLLDGTWMIRHTAQLSGFPT